MCPLSPLALQSTCMFTFIHTLSCDCFSPLPLLTHTITQTHMHARSHTYTFITLHYSISSSHFSLPRNIHSQTFISVPIQDYHTRKHFIPLHDRHTHTHIYYFSQQLIFQFFTGQIYTFTNVHIQYLFKTVP